ncbi:MAG TPA: hypothetical protein VE398_01990 [Acidobacteriota bacterium]|nr:hypothetical protein [Acidobacteriota bacterium]
MRPSLALLACVIWISSPVRAQQRPLKTDDAELVGTGRIRTEFGLEFLQKQRYSLSGLEGDLTRLGVASIHVGMGEYAEFQISGVFQDFLSVSSRTTPVPFPPSFGGNSTNDFGNLVLASKLRLAPEKGLRPALAFKFAVELPNAKHPSGLGTDETEFYASVLMSKHIGRAEMLGNVGFAILQNPVVIGRQTDPITYGLALILPVSKNINLVGEINGRQGPPHRIGNENQSVVRGGLQVRTGSIRWDVAGIGGLQNFDPASGVAVGITYEFQAFHKKPTVK